MRAVIQRVDSAKVSVEESTISVIDKGILVLLGIEKGDEKKDAEYLLEKMINLRIFEDDSGKMNLSLLDISGEMLVVSQFTLLADCQKGRRPSFSLAENPNEAKSLYEYFLSQGGKKIRGIYGGAFQTIMKISLVNDGPVTILLDSRKTL